MEKLIADGKVTRGFLGVAGREITPVMARLLDTEQIKVLIANLDKNGPADRSGLLVNDLIVEINHQAISNFRNALDIVADIRPGVKVPFKVIRKGVPIEVIVTIGEEPETLK